MDLNIIWFVLIIILFIGYAILDGFDLGIGAQILSFKEEKERRVLLKIIGPFWNGNEVWLVAAGGALFAAFPYVYASVFSGLYVALMLLLTGIIFRAVAIEFRNKEESLKWRSNWDVVFSVSSILVLFLLGVAVGNLVSGLPIEKNGSINIKFFDLLNPISIIMGLQSVFFFAMHGSIYGLLKTKMQIQEKFIKNIKKILITTLVFFIINIVFINLSGLSFILEISSIIFIILIFILVNKSRFGLAFISSSISAILYITSLAIKNFPNFIVSTIDYKYSLDIYNASSSSKTLEIMLIIASIGMPIVLFYTIWIYNKFKGKVHIEE